MSISETTMGIVQLIIVIGLFAGLAGALFHMLDATFDDVDDDFEEPAPRPTVWAHPDFYGKPREIG